MVVCVWISCFGDCRFGFGLGYGWLWIGVVFLVCVVIFFLGLAAGKS